MSDLVARPILLRQIRPDPDQPRKHFGEEELAELAESIRVNGLQQPIKVRPNGKGFILIYGERRWRACGLLKARTIDAIVVDGLSDLDVLCAQIIENVQRAQMTPLEEAASYQRVVDQLDGNVVEAARRLGLKHPRRVTERTCLLTLREEHRGLLAKGQLTPTQAFEMAQLQPRNQDRLFHAIRTGLCPSAPALRAAGNALRLEEAQAQMFPVRESTPAERQAVASLEARIDAAVRVLSEGFIQGELVAATRVDPNKAATYADKIALIRQHLASMENALRAAVIRNGDPT